jgi:hypothetical protein
MTHTSMNIPESFACKHKLFITNYQQITNYYVIILFRTQPDQQDVTWLFAMSLSQVL